MMLAELWQHLSWALLGQWLEWGLWRVFLVHCAVLIVPTWRVVPKVFWHTPWAALLKYTALVPLNVAATYAAMLLAPLLAALARPNGWLPFWAKWASTHDEWLYGYATQIGTEPIAATVLARYWQRVRWIWRNPAYHFAHHVCGYKARRGIASRTSDVRNATITGDRDAGTPMFATAAWGDAFYVELVLFGKVRVGTGWKLWRGDVYDPDGVCMMATKIGWV